MGILAGPYLRDPEAILILQILKDQIEKAAIFPQIANLLMRRTYCLARLQSKRLFAPRLSALYRCSSAGRSSCSIRPNCRR
jgi:hypothetical protein